MNFKRIFFQSTLNYSKIHQITTKNIVFHIRPMQFHKNYCKSHSPIQKILRNFEFYLFYHYNVTHSKKIVIWISKKNICLISKQQYCHKFFSKVVKSLIFSLCLVLLTAIFWNFKFTKIGIFGGWFMNWWVITPDKCPFERP